MFRLSSGTTSLAQPTGPAAIARYPAAAITSTVREASILIWPYDLSVLATDLYARYETDQPARLQERSARIPSAACCGGSKSDDLLVGVLTGSVAGVGAPDTGINSVRAVVLLDIAVSLSSTPDIL